ncbi:MAG: MerR family transcriptional regulator [Candidatus Gastranaerophilales bacterium]|nr:MerR family transcriptional regulator [Candidatus Gastranaerophilales bacterium]
MHNKPILTIGIISEILCVHQRTLRIYDKEGILTSKRSIGNRRLYSYNDLEKAKLILYLTRNLALNLSGVKIILGILKEFKIKPSEYMDLIVRVSFKNKINENENIIKTSKRGRKSKQNNILEQ